MSVSKRSASRWRRTIVSARERPASGRRTSLLEPTRTKPSRGMRWRGAGTVGGGASSALARVAVAAAIHAGPAVALGGDLGGDEVLADLRRALHGPTEETLERRPHLVAVDGAVRDDGYGGVEAGLFELGSDGLAL